ncbi:serine carboxypeptidase [Diplogelasinospora grovesii]|uniref:Carboxypeptidase n=1 Tax=Diplogelasinospora grovesii TaxID=303347 RepID=A0AAN6MYF7_9PEZI|nr:serine carboxypeptidase [Diplogelasinospora grovesii]
MKFLNTLLSLLLTAGVASAFDTNYIRGLTRGRRQAQAKVTSSSSQLRPRQVTQSPFYTANTTNFFVNGTTLPDVNFDLGESYAGQLPVGGSSDGNLFFWFWPTTNPDQPKEILLWLNGGPGCSSLLGLLQENGPVSWGAGTYKPVRNNFSWHRLTNVVWVDQPIGTGFSTGTVTAMNEDDVAKQFMGFWKNLMDTFGMQGYDVYIAGESYAGMYCPYIASHFLDANDTTYYNVKGMQINDPVISDYAVSTFAPTSYMVDYWSNVFPLNDTARAQLRNMSASCGYDDFLNTYLTFPPPGPQPAVAPGYYPNGTDFRTECDTGSFLQDAISWLNPAFDMYQITQMLPMPDSVLGIPAGSDVYLPNGLFIGEQTYFNRTDVKQAIHAPVDVDWAICANNVFVEDNDASDPSSFRALPSVIDRTGNVIIAHGMNDVVLIANGTLLAIQNMTWGGKLGFQNIPSDPLFVPRHPFDDSASMSGQGVLGTTHTERGLTWNLVMLTGHMVPTGQPAVAFRQIEFLLGRVNSLSSTQPLSIYPNEMQPSATSIGGPVGPILGRAAVMDQSGVGGGKASSAMRLTMGGSGGLSCSWQILTASTAGAIIAGL